MKKGANNITIFNLIEEALHNGLKLKSQEMSNYVYRKYNDIYSNTSKDTIASILKEEAIINYQEEMFINRLDQDGKGSVDLIAAKINNNLIEIVISQQKGNDGSFNSSSKSHTLNNLIVVKNSDHVNYFKFLPDHLNPIKTGLGYTIDVIIGYTNAYDDKVGQYINKKDGTIINYYCADMYLNKLGIKKISMFEIDYWVSKHERMKNHKYDAISRCHDFEFSYIKCLEIYTEKNELK